MIAIDLFDFVQTETAAVLLLPKAPDSIEEKA